jgi:hypothetical protein
MALLIPGPPFSPTYHPFNHLYFKILQLLVSEQKATKLLVTLFQTVVCNSPISFSVFKLTTLPPKFLVHLLCPHLSYMSGHNSLQCRFTLCKRLLMSHALLTIGGPGGGIMADGPGVGTTSGRLYTVGC